MNHRGVGGSSCFSADYYPYGQENDYDTSCSPTYKFTGYEYDSETGNYYAYARYYDPQLGRFLSPDPLGGDVDFPQTLNRYAYAVNDPCNLIDPLGLSPCKAYKIKFVNENLPLIAPVAAKYNVPVADILGLAANETGFGMSKLAAVFGNYFGVETVGGRPAYDATGVAQLYPHGVLYSAFGTAQGIAPSLGWFAAVYGNTVRGKDDPTAFVESLYGFNHSSRFQTSTPNTIADVTYIMRHCPGVHNSSARGEPGGATLTGISSAPTDNIGEFGWLYLEMGVDPGAVGGGSGGTDTEVCQNIGAG